MYNNMEGLYCRNCGNYVEPQSGKCPHCGYTIQRTNVKTITEKIIYDKSYKAIKLKFALRILL